MEEEIQYSSVVFKGRAAASRNNKEELSVYSSIKSKKPLTSETEKKENDVIYSQVELKTRSPSAPPNQNETISSDYEKGNQKRKKENSPKIQESGGRFHHLLCLGIICFLLCAIIITVIIYFAMETNKQKKNLSDLEAKNERLTLEKRDLHNRTEDLKTNMTKLDNQNQDLKTNMTKLDNQTQQLTAEKMFFKNQTMEMTVNMTKLQNQNEQLRNNSDKLNKILAAIISYPNFPADLFCPDGVCQTCPKDWIQFQESCYFFYNLNSPWKTWDQSRQFCQSNKSDLVVISSLEEQTFIKNTTQYYYDTWHGYWIGLQKVKNNWIWVDGSPDTLGYWKNPGSSDDFAIIAKDPALTQSWIQNRNGFLSRFICEIKALIF